MQMTMLQSLVTIAVIALGTLLTRAAPFVLLRKDAPLPPRLAYLGKVLPCAVMALLVVYCLKDVSFAAVRGWLPQAVCVAVVAALHAWKKNTLLSVGVGTALYLFLVQSVF